MEVIVLNNIRRGEEPKVLEKMDDCMIPHTAVDPVDSHI